MEEGEVESVIDGEEHGLPEVGAEVDGRLPVPGLAHVGAGHDVEPGLVPGEVQGRRPPGEVSTN